MARSVTLNIPPDWDSIDRIREGVLACLREAREEEPIVDALTMVACELTENAVKYGSFDSSAPEIGVILSFACAARRWIERERLLLIVVALQTLFYIAAYLVTPLGLAFHVRWSWDRLVWHLQPIIVFIALVTILPLALSWSPASSTSTSPDA